jgi:ABC-type antimicrobial peptide transport system permease subunit
VPYKQEESVGSLTFYALTELPPDSLLRAVPTMMADIDPNLPVNGLMTLPQQVQENVFLDRFITILSAAFAVLATLLAAVGLYGVLAYTVAQRTREIGLRMALGADAARLRNMVLGQVGRMMLVGGTVGLAAALALGRFAQSLLFEVEGTHPAIIVTALVGLSAVALAAGFVPAHRASRIHPMTALRYK